MKILRNIEVPTGNILIVEGDKGKLEVVSLGDYGKDVNLKADFLGLTRDLGEVKHQKLLPLTDKWVVTISTQYGCNSACLFCDVPKVGPGVNCTYNDLKSQVIAGLSMHPEIKHTNRLNVHYARMGEPTWNPEIIPFTKNMHKELYEYIGNSLIHPVISTMCPNKNKNLERFIADWISVKNDDFGGNAGLQLSINSTSEDERRKMFSGNALTLEEISEIMKRMPDPKGRKYTLNFAVAGYEVDADKLIKLFPADKFLCKLTPMHKTYTALENGIETEGQYNTLHPYHDIEENLKRVGYDVIVFVASEAEDLGRITCGNAILSGTLPAVDYKEIPVE